MSLIVLGRVLLHFRIFPELKRRSIPYQAGSSGDMKAISDYRQVCISEGKPLTLWYVITGIIAVLCVSLAGWFLLIFYNSR